jgi:coenzyme F420-0:L-glutamate ligase/coenzyme F420-1:gamma-L-glutamate ligase
VDELAAATDLVKGKLGGLPVAVVRGFAAAVTEDDGPGAATLLRPGAEDWFRFGHVEAVRAGLGVDDGQVELPSVLPESVATRLGRALDLAQHGSPFRTATLDPGSPFSSRMVLRLAEEGSDAVRLQVFTGSSTSQAAGEEVGPDHWLYLGSLAERIHVAAWSEDLTVEVTVTAGSPPGLRVSATDRR